MNRDDALKVWADEIGDKEYSYDFTGKKIKRSDYMIPNQVGWVIAPIKPLEHGGPDNKNNSMIMHHRTFEEKATHYPTFEIVNKRYIIQHDAKYDFYYIEQILEDEEDDDYYNI